MKTINKKNLEAMQVIPAILIFFMLVIAIITLVYTLDSLQTSFFTSSGTLSVANETITSVTKVGKNLSVGTLRDVACTVAGITNASTGDLITAGNYTVTNCNIKSITNGFFNSSNWNVTYTYTWLADTAASNASGSLTTQVNNAIPLVGIVLVIMLISFIIALLIGFGFSHKKL